MRSESRQSIRWFWQRYTVLAACALAALAAPSQAQTRLFGWGPSVVTTMSALRCERSSAQNTNLDASGVNRKRPR